ncbi:MGMT family protein [Candidatus Woesearchaeota archaeon]|jgi:methylated-DNA-[protein]-cysteine S-methyltransferase|nr:MGMT family protein [Candidatus Woesearchaeota archaeon]
MLTKFQTKCYKLLKQVPKGKVITYKELAKAIPTKAYRAVGTAMGKNPDAPNTPCHRVIKSNGTIGNYSVKGGIKRKIQLLKKEGIIILKDNKLKKYKIKELKKVLFRFSSSFS